MLLPDRAVICAISDHVSAVCESNATNTAPPRAHRPVSTVVGRDRYTQTGEDGPPANAKRHFRSKIHIARSGVRHRTPSATVEAGEPDERGPPLLTRRARCHGSSGTLGRRTTGQLPPYDLQWELSVRVPAATYMAPPRDPAVAADARRSSPRASNNTSMPPLRAAVAADARRPPRARKLAVPPTG